MEPPSEVITSRLGLWTWNRNFEDQEEVTCVLPLLLVAGLGASPPSVSSPQVDYRASESSIIKDYSIHQTEVREKLSKDLSSLNLALWAEFGLAYKFFWLPCSIYY